MGSTVSGPYLCSVNSRKPGSLMESPLLAFPRNTSSTINLLCDSWWTMTTSSASKTPERQPLGVTSLEKEAGLQRNTQQRNKIIRPVLLGNRRMRMDEENGTPAEASIQSG